MTWFHVWFEQIITPLRVLCFNIILVFCFWLILFVSPLVFFLTTTHSRSLSLHHFQFDLLHCLTIDIIATLGILRSMTHEIFYTCCILYMRAWVLIIGYLSLVFLHFYHPITLAYVMSRVLRPPWGHEIRCRLLQPLLGQVFEVSLIFRYHHVSSFGRCLFDVWIQFSCGFGLLGSHIWW